MEKRLNRKGFTLIEVLAVLVILSAIMGIAIPSITSSLERNKEKQNENKKKMLESFAEIYVTDHKNAIYKNNFSNEGSNKCFIMISDMKSTGILPDGADEDTDGKTITGAIVFDREENTYTYEEKYNELGINQCNIR